MNSSSFQQRAETVIPGGVNSPVRAFRSVGGDPLFIKSGSGSHLQTVDGRELLDFCLSFGPLILGHAHPAVVEAVQKAAGLGTSFAVTTEAEIELAELIHSALPSMEKLRLVNSGTEAAMTAMRLARGFTERNKLLKFSGCYHGHSDGMLVQAGSGVAGMAAASSLGVPDTMAAETLVVPFNDEDALVNVIEEYGHDLAGIVVEPIAANMGLVFPEEGFLQRLRECCDLTGSLLIFDEVITGFRLCFGGCQQLCDVTPDLTCLGKIIGGGMPIGAVGGRQEIMDLLAPDGGVYQAGTLSGNPVSVAAGLATLKQLQSEPPYERLEQVTQSLTNGLTQAAADTGLEVQIAQIGSLFNFFFTDATPRCFEDVQRCAPEPFNGVFHECLQQGLYLPPSPFETCFTSAAHTDAELQQALDVIRTAFSHCSA